MPPFVFNDETVVNSYGFMVLNAGGKFERFRENPVMLHLHSQELLTGRWQNLRVEGTKLVADPVFDEEDSYAKNIKGKVDRGVLRGASMGILPLSAELKDIPGKGLVPVVTEWELLEGSTVPVPSNSMSLRLYDREGKVLSGLEEVKLSIDSITKGQPKLPIKMEKIILSAEVAVILGIGSESNVEAINSAVLKLSAEKKDLQSKFDAMKLAKEAAETKLSDQVKLQATTLVDKAIAEGRLTADKKDHFVKLATDDFKQAEAIISAIPAKQNLSGQMKPAGGGSTPESREGWDFMKWSKEDPKGLQLMATQDPTAFEALREAYRTKNQ